MKLKANKKVALDNAKVYPTYDSKESKKSISGEYFIYDPKIREERIRVTDSEDKVGKPCMMTGWVNVNDVNIVESN